MELVYKLEKRMYFLVPYNISEIQKGIQAGHAALRYARKYLNENADVWDFIANHETWIILNGGTTNKTQIPETGLYKGSMDNHYGELCAFMVENPDLKIDFETFNEPDLNDALTAICLIVDERVFNRDDYPDFRGWFFENNDRRQWNDMEVRDLLYKNYVNEVGEDIAFLKELLNTKKLA